MIVLGIGAHPDDVELGCGATLALYKRMGHHVSVLVLTRGEASGDPEIREKECRKSIETLRADKVFFGKLEDTKITDGIETVLEIENIIKEVRPDLVFAHSSKDGHQDHRNAGLASLSAARNSRKILLYESPAALREFCPQVFVDVAQTFQQKLDALKAYGSQASKVYFKGDPALHWKARVHLGEERKFPYVSNAVEGLARFRGFQAGVTLAEAYEVGKFILDV
ncbi:MAG: PIG-L family deacetylase [Candidatus Bathyarchaeia archaeon]